MVEVEGTVFSGTGHGLFQGPTNAQLAGLNGALDTPVRHISTSPVSIAAPLRSKSRQRGGCR